MVLRTNKKCTSCTKTRYDSTKSCCLLRNKCPAHYPPWQPSGSRCMSKVGTWFLKVHVTSLDRIWPKLNRSSGAFGEKCIFGCFKGLLAIFLLERCIVFFSESVESNNKFFGNKKMGVALQKMVI